MLRGLKERYEAHSGGQRGGDYSSSFSFELMVQLQTKDLQNGGERKQRKLKKGDYEENGIGLFGAWCFRIIGHGLFIVRIKQR